MSVIESTTVTTPAIQRTHLMGGAYDLSLATNVDEALALAGLDWEPEKHDLYLAGPRVVTLRGDAPSLGQSISSHQAVLRSDNGKLLGVVGEGFKVVTNRELAEFGSLLVDQAEIAWHAGGALNGGKLPFLQFRLPDTITVAGQDEVEAWVMLTNGHAGNAAMRTTVLPFRLFCGNQVRSSRLAHANYSLRHTGDIAGKVAEARNVLELSTSYMTEFEAIANRLAEIDVDVTFFEDFVTELLPLDADASLRTASAVAKRRAALRQNWKDTETLGDLKETGWGALNVVTEVIDHGRITETRNTKGNFGERRTLSTLVGAGASLRDRAFDLLGTELDDPGSMASRAVIREARLLTVN